LHTTERLSSTHSDGVGHETFFQSESRHLEAFKPGSRMDKLVSGRGFIPFPCMPACMCLYQCLLSFGRLIMHVPRSVLLADVVVHLLCLSLEFFLAFRLGHVYKGTWCQLCLSHCGARGMKHAHCLKSEAPCSGDDKRVPVRADPDELGGWTRWSCRTLWRPCRRPSLERCLKWP
jgi:hypothetical protein